MSKKYINLGKILKKLLFERDMRAMDLAREVNMPPPTIHRIITGKSSRPYKSSLKPIADYFSITVAQLVGEVELPDSKIKKLINLEDSKIVRLPLLLWDELNMLESKNLSAQHFIPFAGIIGKNGFATIMNDSSMEPLFSKETILIFDPELEAVDRGYVLVCLNGLNLFVFRQIIIDANIQYLKPLNSDLSQFQMRILDKSDKVMGCLVEARHFYN